MTLQKAPEPRGVQRGQETVGLVRALVKRGATPEWAEPWRYADLEVEGEALLDLALAWLATGMTATTAIAWCLEGDWLPEVALAWHEDGWSPQETGFLHDRIFYADAESPERSIDPRSLPSAIEWAESGIPRDWILLCVGAGEFDIEQARAMAAATTQNWRIEFGLHVMAHARGADMVRLRMNRQGRVA